MAVLVTVLYVIAAGQLIFSTQKKECLATVARNLIPIILTSETTSDIDFGR